MSSISAGERLDVLDGLRGFAILLVVWYHAWLVSGQAIGGVNFIAEAGFLGVDLFFFISGFCLFYPYARADRDGRPAQTTRRFYARRAAKILPSYFLALAVFALVYHARFASPQDALVQMASHMTFLHTLNPDTFGAISGPLWTIGVEVQFYLLFPLICPAFRKTPLLTYFLLVVAAETYRAVMAQTGFGSTFNMINQLPAYLDLFGAGMLAAYGFVMLRGRAAIRERRYATVVSAAACGLALAGIAHVSGLGHGGDMGAVYDWVNIHRFAIGPLCIALMISTTFAIEPWRSIVSTRALVFLSVISYNLYLWNLEIMVWYHEAGLTPGMTFGLGIATAILLATAITYAIERPILEANLGAWWGSIIARMRGRTPTRDGTPEARIA